MDNKVKIEEGAGVLERFVMGYVGDRGVGLHLVEAIARKLFGPAKEDEDAKLDVPAMETAQKIYATAFGDLVSAGVFSGTNFDLNKMATGAISLDLMVGYAKLVDEKIIPRDVIPSEELVAACVSEFHEGTKNSPAEE